METSDIPDVPAGYDLERALEKSPDVAVAVAAERQRVLAILDMPPDDVGYETLTRELISSGASVETAARRFLEELRNRGPAARLSDLAADGSATVPHAGGRDAAEPSSWGRVTQKLKQEGE